MKIAIIGSKGIPVKYGGIQKVVERIATGLSNLGCDITVYSYYYYSDIKKKSFNYKNFKVINIKGIRSKHLDAISHSFIATIDASLNKNYDIIAFVSTASAFWAFIPKLFGKKVVFHSHGLEFLGYKWNSVDKYIMKLAIRLTSWPLDGVTTVSKSQLKELNLAYHSKAVIIPNGIDYIDVELNYNTQNYILFIGRIVQEKGICNLIDAYNKIAEDYPHFTLKIVGPSVYSDNYMQMLYKKAEQNNRIEFLGAKYGGELNTLYENAYYIVIPSLIEAFPIVLLEALMKNGVVICSDILQLRYLAEGYVEFFKSDSSDDLASKLKKLLDNKEHWTSLKKKSRSFPFYKYTWDSISNLYYDYYKNIVSIN